MITCNLMGGLGNQLFQIFTTISYALDNCQPFVFSNTLTLGEGTTKTRKTYWNNFLKSLSRFLKTNLIIYCNIKEQRFTYTPIQKIDHASDKICMLYGYFQSYKYFEHHFSRIYKMISMDKQKEEIAVLANTYFKDHLNTFVGMHFRIGDYKELQHQYKILGYDYYSSALNYVVENEMKEEKVFTQNVLYFCEDLDVEEVENIICKLKEEFPFYTFIRADPAIEDWQQMIMMSCCRHNIIANSTFSWWGAYFNTNTNRIICSPKTWFSKAELVVDDLLPDSWIKI